MPRKSADTSDRAAKRLYRSFAHNLSARLRKPERRRERSVPLWDELSAAAQDYWRRAVAERAGGGNGA